VRKSAGELHFFKSGGDAGHGAESYRELSVRKRAGELHFFKNTIVTIMNETFSVLFHLPDYKAISNTMQHQKSH